jgi:hypothetical protein
VKQKEPREGVKMTNLKKQRVLVIGLIALVSLAWAASEVAAQDTMVFERLWPKVQKEGVLRVGCAACDPHAIKDPKTGEWSGVAINTLKKLAEALEVKLVPGCRDCHRRYRRKVGHCSRLNERTTRSGD